MSQVASFRRIPLEWVGFALILVFAFALRLYNLGGLPMGLHGDEGIVGYEARRILLEGNIGPYSPASFGQPSGPIYLTAIAEKLGGESIFTIRFISALLGLGGVAAIFGLIRYAYGPKAALLGSFLLAVLPWQLLFSRIAFPLIAWPLCSTLAAWALIVALDKPTALRWAYTGFWVGLGVYAYKAQPLFLLLCVLFGTAWLLVDRRKKNDLAHISVKLAWLAVFLIVMLVTANFLIRYALNPDNNYSGHFQQFSTFNKPEWLQLHDTGTKLQYLVGLYFNWWKKALFATEIDYGDSAGIIPLFSPILFSFALLGFLNFKRRDALVQFSRIIVVVMPIANVITFDAFARRTMAMAPFLVVLAVVGALSLTQWLKAQHDEGKWIVAGMTAYMAYSCILNYFGVYASNTQQAWIFCDELTKSIAYMKTIPPSRPIYFYSDRWSVTYDTRKFLAPNLNAHDRSQEFPDPESTPAGFAPIPGDTAPVWILLNGYKTREADVTAQIPSFKRTEGPVSIVDNQPAFIAIEQGN